MPRRLAPLPTTLPRAFTVASARAAGVTRRRIDGRDLETPFHGVRTRIDDTPDEPIPDQAPLARASRRLQREIVRRVEAYAAVAPAEAIFSHATAAVLWGLPLPVRLLRTTARALDVAVLDTRRAPKAAGVAGHQLRSHMVGVRRHRGVRLTSPATTWALLASMLTIGELIEVADAIVYVPRRRGMERGTSDDALGSLSELAAALAAGRRTGVAKLRAALPEVRVGAASPGETRIRRACAQAGLPEPELDVDVFDATGAPIGFTEFAFARYRVLVEYEGDHHRVDRAQWNRDIDKHAACVAAGWDVVRLTSEHASRGGAAAVARITEALRRGSWSPDST